MTRMEQELARLQRLVEQPPQAEMPAERGMECDVDPGRCARDLLAWCRSRMRGWSRAALPPLRKFVALTASERRLVVSGALWLLAMRLGLWVLPVRTLLSPRPHVVPAGARGRASARLPPEQIAWAVRVASRYMPGTRQCLVQALAAQRLLARRGYPARLCLGVAKDADGAFKAHAWVECAGQIVIGGGGVAGYTPLASFPAPPREPRSVFLHEGERGEGQGRRLP